MRRVIDTDTSDRIVRLYRDDRLSIQTLCERFGFGRTSVHRVLVSAGVEIRPKGQHDA